MQLVIGAGRGHKIRGLSLVELSIILVILGLMAATGLETYRQYQRNKITNITSAAMTQSQQAISAFFFANSRLPCPADPTLDPNDVNAGVEYCATFDGPLGCYGPPGSPGNKMCRVAGARNTANNTGFGLDPVLTGALPYLTLGITQADAMDGWRTKLGYAVTEYMTRPGNGSNGAKGFNDQDGAINILGKDPISGIIGPANNSETGVPRSYLMTVVSYGPDTRGGYNYNGKMTLPCAAATAALDSENCNGDSTFLDPGGGTSSVYSRQLNPPGFYYDDAFLVSRLSKDNDKWSMGGSGTSFIHTKVSGKVGINTRTPATDLDVNGTLRTKNLYASQVCDATGANCIYPTMLGGPGINCNGGLMTGIKAGQPVCLNVVNSTVYHPLICPTGQFVKGFDAGFNVICSP